MLPKQSRSRSPKASKELTNSAEKSHEATEAPVAPEKEAEQKKDSSLHNEARPSNKATEQAEKSKLIEEKKEKEKKEFGKRYYALELQSPLEEPKEVGIKRRIKSTNARKAGASEEELKKLEKPDQKYSQCKILFQEISPENVAKRKEDNSYKLYVIDNPQKYAAVEKIIKQYSPEASLELFHHTAPDLIRGNKEFLNMATELEKILVYDEKAVATGQRLAESESDELGKRIQFAELLYKKALFDSESLTSNIGMVRLEEAPSSEGGKRILLVASSAKLNNLSEDEAIRILESALEGSSLSEYVDIVYLVTKGKENAKAYGFQTTLRVMNNRGVQIYLCAEPKLAAEYDKLQEIYHQSLELKGESHILITKNSDGPGYSVERIDSCPECVARVKDYEERRNQPSKELSPPHTYKYDKLEKNLEKTDIVKKHSGTNKDKPERRDTEERHDRSHKEKSHDRHHEEKLEKQASTKKHSSTKKDKDERSHTEKSSDQSHKEKPEKQESARKHTRTDKDKSEKSNKSKRKHSSSPNEPRKKADDQHAQRHSPDPHENKSPHDEHEQRGRKKERQDESRKRDKKFGRGEASHRSHDRRERSSSTSRLFKPADRNQQRKDPQTKYEKERFRPRSRSRS